MAHDLVQAVAEKFKQELKVIHINAQSLNNPAHFDEFKSLFGDGKIDVIMVSETFFKDCSINTKICNYNVMMVNRKNRVGGGVAIYVREGLNMSLLAQSSGEEGSPEYLICEITFGAAKVLTACVYRPPDICLLDNFQEELCSFITKYKYTILGGDLNARFGTGEFETKLVNNMLIQCNLDPIPFNHTFHTAYSSSTLDVIASNCNDLVIEYGQTAAPGFSGHDLIYAIFNVKVPRFQSKNITFRDFKRLDLNNLYEYGNTLPWEDIYKMNNINDKIQLFNDLMVNVLDTCIPLKTIKIKKYVAPWMTVGLRSILKERDKLRKVFARTKDPKDFEVFRKARNKAKQQCRNAKVKYFNDQFGKCDNSKEMWSVIYSLGLNKKENNNVMSVSLDDLSKHYARVSSVQYPEKVEAIRLEYDKDCDTHYDDRFYFKYITPENIVNTVNSFTSNAVGVDSLSARFVKICLPIILPILEHVLNYSLQNSWFPDLWKMGNIRPIPKVKNPSTCKDYRPVSILCFLSKVLEKLVHAQVNEFINVNNVLPSLQSGFRKGHNTTTALIKVIDDIRRASDKKMLTFLLLLDMSKAFDCVHHNLLLTKLKSLKFSNSVINWFKSYLEGRLMRVAASDVNVSEWFEVHSGVPQGSVLGPLLFTIYLYDLPSVLNVFEYHMYADDIQLYHHFNLVQYDEMVLHLENDLLNLQKYLNSHNLVLNVAKTQAIVLGSQIYVSKFNEGDYAPLQMEGMVIPFQQLVKNLGIIMDPTLSWSEHCNYIINKVFRILAQIRRNASFIPQHVRRTLVQSLILPHFDYMLPLCTNIGQSNFVKLQRAQNACVRFISKVSRFDHITPYYKQLNLHKLDDRQKIIVASMVYKILHFKCPVYLYKQFQFATSSRITRSSNMLLSYPTPRIEAFNQSFFITACKLWNKLELFNVNSMYALKKFIVSKL